MKRLIRKTQKLVKGMPSAVAVSILVHVGIFLLAGVLIVARFIPQKEVVFAPPPPVKTPKMPLKKLTPKMKKPSKPKSTAKITAVVKQVEMDAIQFPDLASSGVGAGLSEGVAGIEIGVLPSFDDDDGILGKEKSIGNDLEGTYYDFKRSRGGSYKPVSLADYIAAVNDFLTGDWSLTRLTRYYRSEQRRYATCIVVPTINSSVAPSAFGEDRASGQFWMVHYKGTIVYPEDITFRFWGAGDHFLGVRVNREVVFFTAWQRERDDFNVKWKSSSSQRATYFFGYDTMLDVGDWITLKANEPQEIEIAMGDNGGLAAMALLVEVKGEKYPQNDQGGPILPIFKTAELSHDVMDMIYKDLYEDDCSLTNGPIFKDF